MPKIMMFLFFWQVLLCFWQSVLLSPSYTKAFSLRPPAFRSIRSKITLSSSSRSASFNTIPCVRTSSAIANASTRQSTLLTRRYNAASGDDDSNDYDENTLVNANKQQQSSESLPYIQRVPQEMEGVPMPFVDAEAQSYIECYPDAIAVLSKEDGSTDDVIEYTIGVPCDYAVALCYMSDAEEGDEEAEKSSSQLTPIELTDPLMDDIFPMAEQIVAEEYGEELVLQRTPQTLTLVGELELDDEEETDDDDEYDEDDDIALSHNGGGGVEDAEVERDIEVQEEDEEDDERVEVLLTFDFRGKEYSLVRILDPILLVGKVDPNNEQNRILLTADESESVMPILEELYLQYQQDEEGEYEEDEDDEEEL